MTLWQDPPPQTRRQARENERAAAQRAENAATSRRAATATPTPAGEIPQVNTPFVLSSTHRESTTDTLTAPTDPVAPVRPRLPRSDALPFDAVLDQPPAGEDVFKPAPDLSRPEPVTAPVAFQNSQPSGTAEPRPAAPAAIPQPVPGHTLTRRELRAMLQAQEANQHAAPASEAAQPQQQEAEPAPVVQLHPVRPASEPATSQPAPAGERGIPAADATAASPADVDETEIHHRRSFQPPTGHWSIAAAQDEEDHTPPGGIPRSAVSTGAATTSNALIMPIVPSVADATGPLTSTGEVLVTGSIDLPRGLGSTGQHPDHFDTSDLDRMFDQPDSLGENTASVAPVRASRAVSTHTSTRGMIAPPNRRGNKLPMTLAITAAVLALGVVGLLVAGFVFHAF